MFRGRRVSVNTLATLQGCNIGVPRRIGIIKFNVVPSCVCRSLGLMRVEVSSARNILLTVSLLSGGVHRCSESGIGVCARTRVVMDWGGHGAGRRSRRGRLLSYIGVHVVRELFLVVYVVGVVYGEVNYGGRAGEATG